MPGCGKSARASRRTIIGRATWPRFRRPCSAAASPAEMGWSLADASPALLLADESADQAAFDDQGRAAKQADGRRRVDVALRVECLTLEGAVADRPHSGQDAGADEVGRATPPGGGLGLVRCPDHD